MSFSKTLLKTLRIISKKGKELDRLKKFVHFQKDQDAVGKVFDFLMTHFDHGFKEVSNEMIWSAVFPEEKIVNQNFLRVYYSSLNKLIEQFLMFEQLKKDDALQQQLLAEAYNGKGQFERFEEANEAAQKVLQQRKDSAFKFSQIAELQQQIFFHPHFKSLEKDDSRLLEMMQYLDESHLMAKLKLMAEYLSIAGIYKSKKEIEKLNLLLDFAQNTDYQSNITIQSYVLLAKLYQNNTYKAYEIANGFYETNKDILSEHDVRSIRLHLQNFLIREINKGNQDVVTKILNNYKIGLENKTLLMNGKITETTFLNIISIACIAKDIVFISAFIADYQHLIDSQNKDIILILATSNFNFCQFTLSNEQHFLDKILEAMSKIKTLNGNVFYNLSQKMTLAKTYYELTAFDESIRGLLKNHLISFLKYIDKNELVEIKRNQYELFCKILGRISDLNNFVKDIQKMKKEKIKEDIMASDMINQDWLLSKLKE